MSIRFLRRASILYLLLPNLLFFIYWTSGIVKLLGLLLCVYLFWNELRNVEYDSKKAFVSRDLIILTIFSLLVTCVSGVSGLCYQTFDHWCHNTKFSELFKYHWPIRIPADGPVIAYYYGFYLVPALYSKITGALSEGAIFLWTFLGFLLGIGWLYQVLNKKIFFVFMALTIGDLPHVIKTLFYKVYGYLYEFGDFGVEAWSNFENLLWVPNQVIPSLIIGGMLVYNLQNKISHERVILPVALSFWWAVFPAFTSGLLIGILVIVNWVKNRETFQLNNVLNNVLLPCLCCLPVLVLFLSHNQAPISGFIWQFSDRMDSRIIEYLINIGLNALIFYLAFKIFSSSKNPAIDSLAFYLILIFLLVFPIFRIGKVNDFLFRGLMPLLIIAGLYLYQNLTAMDGISHILIRIRRAPLIAVVVMLLAGSSLIGMGRIVRAATVNRLTNNLIPDRVKFTPIPYDQYANIYEVLKDKWSQMEADQYLGNEDSIYEQFIAPIKK